MCRACKNCLLGTEFVYITMDVILWYCLTGFFIETAICKKRIKIQRVLLIAYCVEVVLNARRLANFKSKWIVSRRN